MRGREIIISREGFIISREGDTIMFLPVLSEPTPMSVICTQSISIDYINFSYIITGGLHVCMLSAESGFGSGLASNIVIYLITLTKHSGNS